MKTVISVKTDPKIKNKADKIAKKLGIPLSTVMHALLLQFVREQRINLDLNTPELSPKGKKKIDKALSEEDSYEFDSPEEMISFANKMK